HSGKPAEANVDLPFSDHQMKIGRTQGFHSVGFQPDFIEQTMLFHDKVDKFLGSRNKPQLECACFRSFVKVRACGNQETECNEDSEARFHGDHSTPLRYNSARHE